MTRLAVAASAHPMRAWLGRADLLAAVAVAGAAGIAQVALPGGAWMRVVPALAVLFFVPGYLLLEAVLEPAADFRARLVRCAWAIGVSPPLVGVLALATALAPNGFRATAIVLSLTGSCLLLASAALWRRAIHAETPQPVALTA